MGLDPTGDLDSLASDGDGTPEPRARFPWGPVQVVLALFLLHLVIVFGVVGTEPTSYRFSEIGGLVVGRTGFEPWRLVTALFIHADPPHAFWNGFSMFVFAVPLILSLGYLRTTLAYLVGGVAGGLAAVATLEVSTVVVGSSGAVAGLFGAWLAITVRRARGEPLSRRALIRVVGIGLLVLPSLLSPSDSGGHPISVAAHLGGMGAGLVLGAVLARRVEPTTPREPGDDPAWKDE